MNCPIPSHEFVLIEHLVPEIGRVLELGNKRNPNGVYKTWFRHLGIEHVSIDWNGRDGALKVDLREPLPTEPPFDQPFDLVTNFGTSEHISCQEEVWRNMVASVQVGGWLVCTTPRFGDWTWHGQWHPTADFYQSLAGENDFELEHLGVSGSSPRTMVVSRMRRTEPRAREEIVVPTEMIKWNPHAKRTHEEMPK